MRSLFQSWIVSSHGLIEYLAESKPSWDLEWFRSQSILQIQLSSTLTQFRYEYCFLFQIQKDTIDFHFLWLFDHNSYIKITIMMLEALMAIIFDPENRFIMSSFLDINLFLYIFVDKSSPITLLTLQFISKTITVGTLHLLFVLTMKYFALSATRNTVHRLLFRTWGAIHFTSELNFLLGTSERFSQTYR